VSTLAKHAKGSQSKLHLFFRKRTGTEVKKHVSTHAKHARGLQSKLHLYYRKRAGTEVKTCEHSRKTRQGLAEHTPPLLKEKDMRGGQNM
jgi:hypothetical protein